MGVPYDVCTPKTEVCASVSDIFSSIMEMGTSSGIGLVTTMSIGTVVIGKETGVMINGCDGGGEVESKGVSGMISLLEESSKITSLPLFVFLVMCFARSSTLHFFDDGETGAGTSRITTPCLVR